MSEKHSTKGEEVLAAATTPLPPTHYGTLEHQEKGSSTFNGDGLSTRKGMDSSDTSPTFSDHWVLFLISILLHPFLHLFCCISSTLYSPEQQFFFTSHFIWTPFLTFVLLPIIDITLQKLYELRSSVTIHLPKEWIDRCSEVIEWLNQGIPSSKAIYHNILYIYVAIHSIVSLYSLYYVNQLSLRDLRFWMHGVSLGVVGVTSVACSHELMHKLSAFDVFLSKYLLTWMSYTHFAIEHVYGHHKNVATEKDPVSAKYNESFYTFFPKAVVKSYLHSWEVEFNRLESRNISHWNIYHNRMFHYTALYFAVPVLLWSLIGFNSMLNFLVSSFVAILLTEGINYLEHYGLERKKLPGTDQYEPVREEHSWECVAFFSRYITLNLLSHPDHHTYPTKSYQKLKTAPEGVSPMLPYDYSFVVLAAFIPPLFKAIIHPVIDEFKRKQKIE